MGRQLQILILDPSGVISDDFGNAVDSINDVLKAYGKEPVSAGFVQRTYCHSLEDFYKTEFPDLNAKKCMKMHFDFFKKKEKPSPLPGAVDAVKALFCSGFLLCSYSAHRQDLLVNELERYGISNYFSLIRGGADKSKPKDLVSFLDPFKSSRNRMLYVGDTITDANLAKKSGIPFWAVLGYQNISFLENAGVPKKRISNSLLELSEKILSNYL